MAYKNEIRIQMNWMSIRIEDSFTQQVFYADGQNYKLKFYRKGAEEALRIGQERAGNKTL